MLMRLYEIQTSFSCCWRSVPYLDLYSHSNHWTNCLGSSEVIVVSVLEHISLSAKKLACNGQELTKLQNTCLPLYSKWPQETDSLDKNLFSQSCAIRNTRTIFEFLSQLFQTIRWCAYCFGAICSEAIFWNQSMSFLNSICFSWYDCFGVYFVLW